ncbi:glycerate kinase [Labrenzia sp. CE80]|uniref:glycerate kinase type-2 family protein n=1 Tax=Labrenzia sp. CE80 TaxID=1788986 RepID=UPI00129A2305|nr:glycerate kinase [Labrenzia sp. CE80]
MTEERPNLELLRAMFDAAVAAALPENCLPPYLPAPAERGRIILLAAGKGAGAMLEVAERHYRETLGLDRDRLIGLGVTRHGYARPTGTIELIEAGHPVPDQAGVNATRRCLELVKAADRDDHIVVLLSGGGSANWIAPVTGVTLDDKQALTKALLRSGATIDEINKVRKHLSRIKGGRLAALVGDARMTTLAISDVPYDDPAAIASGPTVPDGSTLADAREICTRYNIELPESVRMALDDPANETFKPDDPVFERAEFKIVARPQASLEAAGEVARLAGYEPIFLGDSLEGEARDRALEHAGLAKELAKDGKRAVLLSGGELTVTIAGDGSGGPNQEYALALALGLSETPMVSALAADTDGTDGGKGLASDPAGAYVFPSTIGRARSFGLDPASFLVRNDSMRFFHPLSDLLVPGPTFTNVNDFRAIIVDNTDMS